VKRVLIANRGEIAVRILRTCHAMGLEAYVATSEADRDSRAARLADRAVCIGPGRPADSYLRRELMLEAASKLDCDAIHPGYGFLAEDPLFAEGCADADIRFIGPSPDNLRLFGDKVSARTAAAQAGVPIAAGSPPIDDVDLALTTARDIGFPVMIKAAKGGGGKGMRVVTDEESLRREFPMASTEAAAAFGDGAVYLERFVRRGRHVEVQVVGSPAGEVVHLGDRDCSVQRQNQKLIEEAPAPFIEPGMQEDLRNAAVQLARSSGYDNVGTVEFLLDAERGEFYFLEVNPRIQVEHGVTELVTGRDIVALQLQIADTGRHGLMQEDIDVTGSAIECRINAESPRQGFRPSPGRIVEWMPPDGPSVRVDTHCYPGYFVPPFYDSLLAKVMVHEDDRDTAIAGLLRALSQLHVTGVDTTADLARSIVGSAEFARLDLSTRWLGDLLARGRWPGDDQGRQAAGSSREGVSVGHT
jgi:acetyl-CoA carboxylase biotin carboxylase subunit